MKRASVYLNGGQIVELSAEKFAVTCGNLNGELRKLSWVNLKGPEPLFFNPHAVSFITVEEETD